MPGKAGVAKTNRQICKRDRRQTVIMLILKGDFVSDMLYIVERKKYERFAASIKFCTLKTTFNGRQ